MEKYAVLLVPVGLVPKCVPASDTDVIPVSTVLHTHVSVGHVGCVVHFMSPVLLGSSSSDKWLFEDHTVCYLKRVRKAALDSQD